MLAFSGNPLSWWSRDSMQWAYDENIRIVFFQHFERSPGDASGLGKQQCICQNWQMYLSSSVMHGVWKKRRWCNFLTMGALDSHWTAAAKQPSKCKIKALKGFPEEKFSHRTQNRIKGNNRSKCQELLLEPSKPSPAVDDLMCCCAQCARPVHIVHVLCTLCALCMCRSSRWCLWLENGMVIIKL